MFRLIIFLFLFLIQTNLSAAICRKSPASFLSAHLSLKIQKSDLASSSLGPKSLSKTWLKDVFSVHGHTYYILDVTEGCYVSLGTFKGLVVPLKIDGTKIDKTKYPRLRVQKSNNSVFIYKINSEKTEYILDR